MKHLIFLTVISLTSASFADVPANCQVISEVRVGDKFTTYPKSTIQESLSEEKSKLGADGFSAEYAKHTHGKLGSSYSARAKMYKCPK